MSENVLNKYPALSFSVIVGLTVVVLDFIIHSTIWNEEVLSYFIVKPFIAGAIAFLAYRMFINIPFMKENSPLSYVYYSFLFAGVHGLYYRVIELITNQGLFTRVGDLNLGVITLAASTTFIGILIGGLNGLIVHGTTFFVGVMLAKMIVGDD